MASLDNEVQLYQHRVGTIGFLSSSLYKDLFLWHICSIRYWLFFRQCILILLHTCYRFRLISQFIFSLFSGLWLLFLIYLFILYVSCKDSRKECASFMVGLPVPFRYEYLMAETIFSQVCNAIPFIVDCVSCAPNVNQWWLV